MSLLTHLARTTLAVQPEIRPALPITFANWRSDDQVPGAEAGRGEQAVEVPSAAPMAFPGSDLEAPAPAPTPTRARTRGQEAPFDPGDAEPPPKTARPRRSTAPVAELAVEPIVPTSPGARHPLAAEPEPTETGSRAEPLPRTEPERRPPNLTAVPDLQSGKASPKLSAPKPIGEAVTPVVAPVSQPSAAPPRLETPPFVALPEAAAEPVVAARELAIAVPLDPPRVFLNADVDPAEPQAVTPQPARLREEPLAPLGERRLAVPVSQRLEPVPAPPQLVTPAATMPADPQPGPALVAPMTAAYEPAQPPPREPDVHISIGRVEVRAAAPAPAPARREPAAKSAPISLDAYLSRRGGGAR